MSGAGLWLASGPGLPELMLTCHWVGLGHVVTGCTVWDDLMVGRARSQVPGFGSTGMPGLAGLLLGGARSRGDQLWSFGGFQG